MISAMKLVNLRLVIKFVSFIKRYDNNNKTSLLISTYYKIFYENRVDSNSFFTTIYLVKNCRNWWNN